MQKVILLKTIHNDWLPKGTIGTIYIDDEGFKRFMPDNPVIGYGFNSTGVYGITEYKIIDDGKKNCKTHQRC